MKLCYVLPQYYKNSTENFSCIANFLSELGKQIDLYIVIEHSDTVSIINKAVNNTIIISEKYYKMYDKRAIFNHYKNLIR